MGLFIYVYLGFFREPSFIDNCFYRVLIGALILTLVVYAKGLKLPFTVSVWLSFLVMGIVGYVLSFFLISWGQLSINSGIDGNNANNYNDIGVLFS